MTRNCIFRPDLSLSLSIATRPARRAWNDLPPEREQKGLLHVFPPVPSQTHTTPARATNPEPGKTLPPRATDPVVSCLLISAPVSFDIRAQRPDSGGARIKICQVAHPSKACVQRKERSPGWYIETSSPAVCAGKTSFYFSTQKCVVVAAPISPPPPQAVPLMRKRELPLYNNISAGRVQAVNGWRRFFFLQRKHWTVIGCRVPCSTCRR